VKQSLATMVATRRRDRGSYRDWFLTLLRSNSRCLTRSWTPGVLIQPWDKFIEVLVSTVSKSTAPWTRCDFGCISASVVEMEIRVYGFHLSYTPGSLERAVCEFSDILISV
jgi:hypothetical protein